MSAITKKATTLYPRSSVFAFQPEPTIVFTFILELVACHHVACGGFNAMQNFPPRGRMPTCTLLHMNRLGDETEVVRREDREAICNLEFASIPLRPLLMPMHTRFKQCTDVALAGHSLGGALATLAAYDLATELGLTHLQCITFGAPRVGNSVFVADFNRHVPDTWCGPPPRPPSTAMRARPESAH